MHGLGASFSRSHSPSHKGKGRPFLENMRMRSLNEARGQDNLPSFVVTCLRIIAKACDPITNVVSSTWSDVWVPSFDLRQCGLLRVCYEIPQHSRALLCESWPDQTHLRLNWSLPITRVEPIRGIQSHIHREHLTLFLLPSLQQSWKWTETVQQDVVFEHPSVSFDC